MDTQQGEKKNSLIRHAYFYIASLVTLGFVIGSIIALVTIGLQAWVLTGADPVENKIGPPPSVYMYNGSNEALIESGIAYECTEGCELTEENLTMVSEWEAEYKSWQAERDNPGELQLRDVIAALSFLIISLPIFIIHNVITRRDEKKSPGQAGVIRTSYFYFVSLAALIMIVISAGVLINTGLKTWLLPNTSENNKRYVEVPPLSKIENQGVNSIINCADECDFTENQVALAQGWDEDFDSWSDASGSYNSVQNQASTSIPYLLIGIPLFWYHWSVTRKESKLRKQEKQSDNIQS